MVKCKDIMCVNEAINSFLEAEDITGEVPEWSEGEGVVTDPKKIKDLVKRRRELSFSGLAAERKGVRAEVLADVFKDYANSNDIGFESTTLLQNEFTDAFDDYCERESFLEEMGPDI